MFENLEKMDIWGWNATHPLYYFHKRYIFCYIFRLSFGFFANHWLAKMIFWNQSLIASLLNDDMRNEILSDEYILTLGLIIWSAYNLILKTPHAIYRYMLSIFAKKELNEPIPLYKTQQKLESYTWWNAACMKT